MIVLTGKCLSRKQQGVPIADRQQLLILELADFRPAGLPLWCGIRCRLVMRGLHVRLPDSRSALYCLRIETDPRIVAVLGDLANEFHFAPADFAALAEDDWEEVCEGNVLLLGTQRDDTFLVGEITLDGCDLSLILGHRRMALITETQRHRDSVSTELEFGHAGLSVGTGKNK